MFKNAILYRVAKLPIPATSANLAKALEAETYQPCTLSQERSCGWAPPRGEAHGALIETVGTNMIGRFVIETRTVPGDAIRKRADELAAKINHTRGCMPGKKEMRDLRDVAHLELLPHAFSKVKSVWVWFDRPSGRLVLDTASPAVADTVITSLVKVMPKGFTVGPVQTARSPQACMAVWLRANEELPYNLYLNRAVELRGAGDKPVRIKFSGHELETPEIRQHVANGVLPVSLSLSYDGSVYFTLTDKLQLRAIRLGDDVLDAADQDPDVDRFDADVTLVTGALWPLIDDLLGALGGEVEK